MTKLLDLAIEKVRKLPEADQDDTADLLLWTLETRDGAISLDDETALAIEDGLVDAKRGDFASDAEIAAMWKRHGL